MASERLADGIKWQGHALMVFALVMMWTTQALARIESSPDSAGSGQLMFTLPDGTYTPATLLQTEVDLQATGLLMQGVLRQRFRNESDQWLEAVYVFPLPDDSAVYSLVMQVGERRIQGEIQEKQQAQKTYQTARKEGKRAVLVDQERPNLFTSRVANIAPGSEISVELKFQGQLQYGDQGFEWRMPMTSTPRYMPGRVVVANTEEAAPVLIDQHGWAAATDQVPDAPKISPFTVPVSELLPGSHRARVRFGIQSGLPLANVLSPSHPVHYRENTGYQYEVVLGEQGELTMDRDLVVRWQVVPGAAPRAAAFRQISEHGAFSMIMLMPPSELSEAAVLPRSLILVVDTSGSMAGTSMAQARTAVTETLASLRPQDRFNLIQFNSSADALFESPVSASPSNIQKARRYADSLVADGGTEMSEALALALHQPHQAGFVPQVVFMTDGSVGNEQALFRQIEQQLGRARLFTVGIGSAPNSYFMRKAAQVGRGAHLFINDIQEVQSQLGQFLSRLEKPVLSDLKLAFDGEADIQPNPIGDLYAGEPLMIVARSEQPLSQFRVSAGQVGEVSADAPLWQQVLDMNLAPTGAGIDRHWARQKIESHLDSKILGVDEADIRAQVLPLALTYQLVSPYTSFVAVDHTPVRPQSESLRTDAVPQLLPKGASNAMVRYPATATSARVYLLQGILGLLLGLGLWLWPRRRFTRVSGRL